MFGMEYVVVVIKILWTIAFAIITAIPATIAWNCIAPIYLAFIPQVYQNIPYLKMLCILLVITFVGDQIKKLTPTIISVSQNNK